MEDDVTRALFVAVSRSLDRIAIEAGLLVKRVRGLQAERRWEGRG